MYKKKTSHWIKHVDFMLLDLLCMEVSVLAACIVRPGSFLSGQNGIYRDMAIILFLLNVVVGFFGENYTGILRRGYFREFTASLKQTAGVLAVFLLYLFLDKSSGKYSRMILVLFWCLYTVLTYTARLLWKRHVIRHRQKQKGNLKMYLVTSSDIAENVIANIQKKNMSDMVLDSAAVVDTDLLGTSIRGVPVTGNKENVADYIRKNWIDGVFFNCSSDHPVSPEIVKLCADMGVSIYLNMHGLEQYGGSAALERLAGYTVLGCNVNRMSVRDAAIKRAMDIVGGLLGCLCTLIFLCALFPVIKVKSPGPVFFSQIRVGRNGKQFRIYKFRSMYNDAEKKKKELMAKNKIKSGMMFKVENDPRIIQGIGNFIRKTSIDEFPQFFNVLRGDMSLVGTRPPTVEEWEKYEYHHRKRLAMKPGITGLWQVSGRSEITDFEEVVRLDTEYIRNWTLGSDLKILLKTVGVVFRKDGAM